MGWVSNDASMGSLIQSCCTKLWGIVLYIVDRCADAQNTPAKDGDKVRLSFFFLFFFYIR